MTQTIDTNPKTWTTTSTVEPAWGLATSTVDPNGRRPDYAYDGLGRLTGVWLPGRVKGTDTPDRSYAYLLRTDGAVAVTSTSLNPAGVAMSSYSLYDGLLRPAADAGGFALGRPACSVTPSTTPPAGP